MSVRACVVVLLCIGLVVTDVALLVHNRWWILAVLLTPYRLVNLVRFARYRLRPERLSSVCLRSHGWLAVAQVVFGATGWALHLVPFVSVMGFLAGVQFLVALVLLRASMSTWEHAKPVDISQHYTDKELPTMSVLIPARDETDALQRCLDSLIRNDYPKLEIIVLDDCSLDRRTPEIIRGYAHDGVRFIQGNVPPNDWVAKNFAYEQLRNEASGELLLFCGVDTEFESRTLRALVEAMLLRGKDMVSVLPTRTESGQRTLSILQTMRYYWELCLPRRLFKRPPVLSTCWLVRASQLEDLGGFSSVSQSVSPEAHFARRSVVGGAYTFLRTFGDVQVHSGKTFDEQYETTVRLRYPQLHRRLELVAATVLFELIFFVGPFVSIPLSVFLPHSLAFLSVWLICVLTVEVMYYLIAVQTKLHSPLVAFASAPLAFAADIYMLHMSMLRYEFGTVNWKGRNVCIPVMRVEPSLPKLPE